MKTRRDAMAKKFQGIVTPLLTPFTADGERVDLGAYRALIDHVIGAGVHAIISNAATSEFSALDDRERMDLAATAIEHARGRVPVLVGASSDATRGAIKWAKHAKSLGADGLLLTPTYYGRPTIEATVRHYAAVSDAADTPIMLYNAPYAHQVLLTPADIIRIADRSNIPWVKLTTGVIDHVTLLRAMAGDRFAIFEGVDTLAFPSMALGAVGWVAGPSNMIPEHAVELWRLTCIAQDMKAARALNDRIDPIQRMATTPAIYYAWIKEICRLRGIPLGS
ncbi:MAG: dihydrodipicolinate synthase family protein, partial [Alphaproteobacteria bacterium]|nr:dihydrodipicolinate synthase family protein [Alphaproteobacteria bacterium]